MRIIEIHTLYSFACNSLQERKPEDTLIFPTICMSGVAQELLDQFWYRTEGYFRENPPLEPPYLGCFRLVNCFKTLNWFSHFRPLHWSGRLGGRKASFEYTSRHTNYTWRV